MATVEVEIDIGDYLGEISTAELRGELRRRLKPETGEMGPLEELRSLIHCRDWAGALAAIEKLMASAA